MIGSRAAGLVLLWALAVPCAAQEPATRVEALERERAEKAATLSPPEQGGLERALLRLENGRYLERILYPEVGFYPKVGTIIAGSGLSGGAGYRFALGETARLNTFGWASLRGFWMLEARLTAPEMAHGRLFADVHVQRYSYADQDFFGLGPNSSKDDFATYGYKNLSLGGTGGVRPVRWLSVGGTLNWFSPRIDQESGGGQPISGVFPGGEIPGFNLQPDYLLSEAFVEANTRQPPLNPRRGGRYRLSYGYYNDRTENRFSFDRIEADAQHYFPMLNERRVIALHALASLSEADAGQEVPFYMQRTLGGPDDLRGFERYRFRDTNLVLLQAEYRFEVFTAVDAAIFFDAGSVAPRREDLRLDDLETDYGIGFRFGSDSGVFARIEGAFGGREGARLVLRWGNVF
jgi:hypothetical protein